MDENTAVQQAQELETVETAQETQGETLQDTSAAPETTEQPQEPKKRRGGRKPMTPEEKAARKAQREARAAAAEAGEQEPKKRRGGRKPFTAAQKAAAAKAREEAMQKAANLIPEVHVQYQDSDADMQTLIAAAKEDFRSVKKRMRITDMKLYVKPEERTAYYVINDEFSGKVTY